MNTKHILMAAVAACMLLSCGKKEETNDIIIENIKEQPKQVVTQQMESTLYDEKAEWLGKTYSIRIQRSADKSLKLAKDEVGTKYYDNKISIEVCRNDGSVFFNRTFTKSDFAQHLNGHTLSDGALLGLMYSKSEGDYLVFEGSIGSPDALSDDFIPVVIKLSRTGNVSISRGTTIDTSGEDDMPV